MRTRTALTALLMLFAATSEAQRMPGTDFPSSGPQSMPPSLMEI